MEIILAIFYAVSASLAIYLKNWNAAMAWGCCVLLMLRILYGG